MRSFKIKLLNCGKNSPVHMNPWKFVLIEENGFNSGFPADYKIALDPIILLFILFIF